MWIFKLHGEVWHAVVFAIRIRVSSTWHLRILLSLENFTTYVGKANDILMVMIINDVLRPLTWMIDMTSNLKKAPTWIEEM